MVNNKLFVVMGRKKGMRISYILYRRLLFNSLSLLVVIMITWANDGLLKPTR
jgi:hypothetical protein